MCGICNITNEEPPVKIFSEEEYDRLIEAIWFGSVTVQYLDPNFYFKTAKKLTEGIYKGFKFHLDDTLYKSPNYNMLVDLRENVYIFSGAKNYQSTKYLSGLLSNKDEVNTFYKFKELALPHLKEYNENYLSVEYDSAMKQARSASQWMDIEENKDILPMLQYHTVGDARVRPTHRDLDGIARPVDDKFWDKYMPPNGWNCRCTVLQSDSSLKKTSLRGFVKPDDVPEIFLFNAGKDRIIFSPKHPYFEVAQKDKSLARKNFNMPLP